MPPDRLVEAWEQIAAFIAMGKQFRKPLELVRSVYHLSVIRRRDICRDAFQNCSRQPFAGRPQHTG